MMFGTPFPMPPVAIDPRPKAPYSHVRKSHKQNPPCSSCKVTLNSNKICYNRMCKLFAKEPAR